MCDAVGTADRLAQKKKEYLDGLTVMETMGHLDIDLKQIVLKKDEVKIEDMAWDPYEPNILVSYADGSMSLITY
jgi:hypothetical protein